MKKTILSTLFFCAFAVASVLAQGTPVGIWKTVDDNTGETKSQVEIYEQNGKYFGKVVKLLIKPDDTICEKCKGAKKNKPVVGMVIIEDLEKHKDYWKNGTIMDPENGNEYGCSVWFENGDNNELKVRGKHWTGLYRTQTWYRVL